MFIFVWAVHRNAGLPEAGASCHRLTERFRVPAVAPAARRYTDGVGATAGVESSFTGLAAGTSSADADSAIPRPDRIASAMPAANNRMDLSASSLPGMT